jgi:ubiquinone/menaquinone biosynthesis C-methylase UbiE
LNSRQTLLGFGARRNIGVPFLDHVLAGIIAASQKTPFRARGGYSSLPLKQQQSASGLDKAAVEARDFERFFSFFPHHHVKMDIAGKYLLDFGSGYGGRTVEYVRSCGAERAAGVEPYQENVDAGSEFAAQVGLSERVEFKLCTQTSIPYENETFDAAVTFDVLEHVDDPRISLREIWRVLKPGGILFAVFPVYRGLFSHHLDYLTMFPALHLMFSPDRLLRVVNTELDRRPEIVVRRHASPAQHFASRKPILPTLNGMGLRDFREAAANAGFDLRSMRLNGVADMLLPKPLAAVIRPLLVLPSLLSEPFIFNVAATLYKH